MTRPLKKPRPPRDRRSTSAALRDFIDAWEGERLSLNDLRLALGDRAYGALLVIFAAPNLIPISIPGLSAILGVPLMLLAAQLMLGQPHPWFPRFLGRRSFATSDFRLVMDRTLPILARFERVLGPRLGWLTSWTGERVLGLFCLILAAVLALPIPFGNFLPAVGIILLALALIEKDGLAYLAGVAVGIASLVIASGVVFALAKAAFYALEKLLS